MIRAESRRPILRHASDRVIGMFWCAARLQTRREPLALKFLKLHGFVTYYPQLREHRVRGGRKVETARALFPGYAFVLIQLQWHAARWCPGVIGLIMDGVVPGHVPDHVVAEIRGRERNGLVELPKPRGPQIGDPARILGGPFEGHLGLYQGMKPHDRVEVLLAILGARQRVELPKADVEVLYLR